jgi:hypothetical protein
MINSIVTRHKEIPFSSGVFADTIVHTLAKKSRVEVQFTAGAAGTNVNVRVYWKTSASNSYGVTIAESRDADKTTRNLVDLVSHSTILEAGSDIRVLRSVCNLTIHVFELE